jgi:hypothetical protein
VTTSPDVVRSGFGIPKKAISLPSPKKLEVSGAPRRKVTTISSAEHGLLVKLKNKKQENVEERKAANPRPFK